MSSVEAKSVPARRAPRTTGGASLGREASREAKRLAAAILEVLAGERTPAQAASSLGISLVRYYQREAAGLRALLTACEVKPRGRVPDATAEVTRLRRQNAQLQRDLARQQALVRLTQRTTGLTAPAPSKSSGKKTRSRKPVTRALTVAQRLRSEADTGVAEGGSPSL